MNATHRNSLRDELIQASAEERYRRDRVLDALDTIKALATVEELNECASYLLAEVMDKDGFLDSLDEEPF